MRYNVPYFVTKGFYVIIDKSIVTFGFKSQLQHLATLENYTYYQVSGSRCGTLHVVRQILRTRRQDLFIRNPDKLSIWLCFWLGLQHEAYAVATNKSFIDVQGFEETCSIQYYLRSLPGWYYYQSYQTGRVLATSVDTRCKPIYQTNPGSYLSKSAHLLGILEEEVFTDHKWEQTMEKMIYLIPCVSLSIRQTSTVV